jgi:hypothetical protein
MPVVRAIIVGFVGALLAFAVAACGPAPANKSLTDSGSQVLSAVAATLPQPSDDVVWGKVPYCSCLAESATANVASALKNAKLTVHLKELSPRDGWLYFAVTYDPHAVQRDQVDAALVTGGAQVLQGPP